jgi:allantoate deiminase
MNALAEKAIRYCRHLSTMTEEPGRTTRTFLSPPMHDVHRTLSGWMTELGMSVHVDAAGNLRGLHGDAAAPRIVVGSHLDSVPNAGAFDGILGVVMGIALVESKPGTAVEVVGFSEEEGVRYGFPFIGSRAYTGTLGSDLEIVAPAIRAFGLDPAEVSEARFSPHSRAYLEFHIEQGPILESLNLPLAVVDNIVGLSRYRLTFTGRANHAGTTPMHLRHDALAAASEWVGEVERAGIIATVGSLKVRPNAANAIPGEVQASLDVRHPLDAVRRAASEALLRKADEAAQRRGVVVTHEGLLDQEAVPMAAVLRDQLASAVHGAGYPVHHMDSGAGHDAMILAPHLPSAMLFLRSPGGISHHPDEDVLLEDVVAALEVGARFIRSFAHAC